MDQEDGLKPLAAAIIPRGERVLLTERRLHQHGEAWSWPSGKVEPGESLEEAIVRELYEELLLGNVKVVRRLGDIDLASGFRMSHFHVTIPDDAEPVLNDHANLSQIRWMTREEAQQAFRTLDPTIAQGALRLIDDVLRHEQLARGLHSRIIGG